MNALNTIVSLEDLRKINVNERGSFNYDRLNIGYELGTWDFAAYFSLFQKAMKLNLKITKRWKKEWTGHSFLFRDSEKEKIADLIRERIKNKKRFDGIVGVIINVWDNNFNKPYKDYLLGELAINLHNAEKLLSIFESKEKIIIYKQ